MASYKDGPSEGTMRGMDEIEPEGLTLQQERITRGLQDLEEAISFLIQQMEPVLKSKATEEQKSASYSEAMEASKASSDFDAQPSPMAQQAQSSAYHITTLKGMIHELRYRLDF